MFDPDDWDEPSACVQERIRICVKCGEEFIPEAALDGLTEDDADVALDAYYWDDCPAANWGSDLCRASWDEVEDDLATQPPRQRIKPARRRRNGRLARLTLAAWWLRGFTVRPYGPHEIRYPRSRVPNLRWWGADTHDRG